MNGTLSRKLTQLTEEIYDGIYSNLLGNASYLTTPIGYSLEVFEIYDTALYDFSAFSEGNDIILPNFEIQPFTHLKRYKEDGFKKLFLTSRYLENAVINENDEITKLYSDILPDDIECSINPEVGSLDINGGLKFNGVAGVMVTEDSAINRSWLSLILQNLYLAVGTSRQP